ncbi:MAG: CoA transferase subunit A [Paracoccaceae bacterium]
MDAVDHMTVEEMADAVPNGALLGVPADYSGVSMAVTRALIARGAKDLRLYCLPLTTMQGDMLIGAGCVSGVEAAAVTLGEYGLAPCFSRAVQGGAIAMRDSTCPALHTQLQAVEKGVPFMPLRGLIGSDVARMNPDWKVIENPFEPGDAIMALPARPLDVTVFHAPAADRAGNIFIGRQREVASLIYASREVYVTVEKFVDTDFYETEATAAGVIPAFYFSGVAEAKNGAWPIGLTDQYAADGDAIRAYASAAQTPAGFESYLAEQGIRRRTAA